MAKYHRTRKYTRYRRRSNWSSNIAELSFTINQLAPGANISTFVLAQNPAQDNTTVSTIYTVKNFEINYTFESETNLSSVINNVEDICAYIVYVPQGMTVGVDYPNLHPEYVMAMKFVGSPSNDAYQEYQPYRISTRLARRLNTGDSVQLLVKLNWTSTNGASAAGLEFHGIHRWWTKSN